MFSRCTHYNYVYYYYASYIWYIPEYCNEFKVFMCSVFLSSF